MPEIWHARRRSVAFCTLASRAYLPWALVLLDAIRSWHPRAALLLLYVRQNDEEPRLPVVPGVHVLSVGDLVAGALEAGLRRRYSLGELCFCLKPRLLQRALAQGVERAIYLDADIDLYAPLDDAMAALETASAVVTPHLARPIPIDDLRPSELSILRAGSFNMGFIGVSRDEEAARMLEWWDSRVLRWGYVAPEFGYLGDQRWMDLAPSLFARVTTLRHPGMNIGHWNLHSRRIERDDAGVLRAEGAPLVFVHFSGFDPLEPERLSRYQDRASEAEQPVLMALAADYARRLLDAKTRVEALEWRADASAPAATGATAIAGPMPVTAYRVQIEAVSAPLAVEPKEEVRAKIRITNRSEHLWPVARPADGMGGIFVSWHWRDKVREVIFWDNPRCELPHDIAPAQSMEVEVEAMAPEWPGDYFLQLDLVHEAHCWFSERGGSTLFLPIHVRGGERGEEKPA